MVLLGASRHPLAIVGKGDIVDLNGTSFGCTLEQYQVADIACTENDIQGDYLVNYVPTPRTGWEFSHWKGSCGHLSEPPNCRFDVPAVWVNYWDTEIGVPIPTLTAVFTEIDPPQAEAGADQVVDEQVTVTLDASSSAAASGTIELYEWSQLSGTAVEFDPTIQKTTNPIRTFTAPTLVSEAILVFEVTVTDSNGLTAVDSVAITVQPVNATPTAEAGGFQHVNSLATVLLPGAGADSDGTVTFQWAQVEGPHVELSAATTPTLTFVAPTVTDEAFFIFELTVTDNEGATATDRVTIRVTPIILPATANAGADQEVVQLSNVSLDGTASSTGSGETLTYTWQQTSGPDVEMIDADTEAPSFTAPRSSTALTLAFELTVTDSLGSSTDAVTITVNPTVSHDIVYSYDEAG